MGKNEGWLVGTAALSAATHAARGAKMDSLLGGGGGGGGGWMDGKDGRTDTHPRKREGEGRYDFLSPPSRNEGERFTNTFADILIRSNRSSNVAPRVTASFAPRRKWRGTGSVGRSDAEGKKELEEKEGGENSHSYFGWLQNERWEEVERRRRLVAY